MKKLLLILPLLALLGCQTTGPKTAWKYNNWEKFPLEPNAVARHPSSNTDSDVLVEGGRIVLEKCGGSNSYATMHRNYNGELLITIANVNCNYYKTQFMLEEAQISSHLRNRDKSKTFSVQEDIPGWHKLVIGSKTYFNNPEPGSRADEIYFYIPAKTVNVDLYLQNSSYSYQIPGCGGSVRAQINNGLVNVIFQDVQNCDTVTMFKDSQEKTYKLQNQGYYFGGSYTIPTSFVDLGSNWVNFQIYQKYKNEAKIRVNFFGL